LAVLLCFCRRFDSRKETRTIRRPSRDRKPPAPDSTRVNERIRAREIRLIGANGEQLGVMTPYEALQLAREHGEDLVEVAAKANPPVCRIMDYGKYKYEQAKRTKEAKKNQHQMGVKEVKFRPKTSTHDYDFKMERVKEFLGGGDKVKVTLMFRGRENAHPEVGERLLHRLIQDVQEVGAVEQLPKREMRTMVMVLVPKR